MSSEPKKPIEEMLEASARARRAAFGSDPKMPNPMRARLHDEIGQLEHGDRSEGRKSWLQMFWPRITVAAALATLLILGPLMWWRSSRSTREGMMEVATRGTAAADEQDKLGELRTSSDRLTSNEVSRGTEADSAAAHPEDVLANGPAASAAGAPQVNLADNAQTKIEPATTPSQVTEEASVEMSKRFAAAAAGPTGPAPATKGYISKDQTAAGAAAETAASKARRPAADTTPQQSAQSAAQAFRNNSQANQVANVLNNFQVQQEGSEIRVIDSDGSIYTGNVEPIAGFTDRIGAKEKRSYDSRIKPDNNDAAVPQSQFRARGYNVSLKKTLTFEGNYIGPPQQQPRQNFLQNTRPQENEQATRIVGTARVHGEPPVRVDATAVEEAPKGNNNGRGD
jgi:hypothetical protein